MIPCKECITYAICKQKSNIHCQELFEFIHNKSVRYTSDMWKKVWMDEFKQLFPNLINIHPNVEPFAGIGGFIFK